MAGQVYTKFKATFLKGPVAAVICLSSAHLPPQFSSSLPSKQSLSPSHFQVFSMHEPDEHRNSSFSHSEIEPCCQEDKTGKIYSTLSKLEYDMPFVFKFMYLALLPKNHLSFPGHLSFSGHLRGSHSAVLLVPLIPALAHPECHLKLLEYLPNLIDIHESFLLPSLYVVEFAAIVVRLCE